MKSCMPQSFSFGFGSDDIEFDVDETKDTLSLHTSHDERPITIIEPKLQKLEDMLSALPSHISYSTIQIRGKDGNIISLPRRELFDIRAQLMAEDDSSKPSTAAIGLSVDDITPNVYEGGFKTWECSVDLASHLFSSLSDVCCADGKEWHIVEVGAGTALPTLVFFHYFLKHSRPAWRSIHLSFADYNQSVLETATVPNLLLTWYFARSSIAPEPVGDLEITPDLIAHFLKELADRIIYVSGVSGSWNQAFSGLIKPSEDSQRQDGIETIFLASETIYSPTSIRAFTQVLMTVLMHAEETNGRAKALVAAKRMYFGVGGGIDEFITILEELGGKYNIVWETQGTGVGRVILEVVKNR